MYTKRGTDTEHRGKNNEDVQSLVLCLKEFFLVKIDVNQLREKDGS